MPYERSQDFHSNLIICTGQCDANSHVNKWNLLSINDKLIIPYYLPLREMVVRFVVRTLVPRTC